MTRLRVVTINVQNDKGDSRRTSLIQRELRRLDPDLVALQEVLHTPERNQLDERFEGLGHHRRAALAFNQPVDGVWPSDHFGVVVDVEIGQA